MTTCLTCNIYNKCFASKLNKKEIAEINERIFHKKLKKDDTIFREKAFGKNFYMLLDGKLKAECEDSSGKPVIMRIAEKGESIGLEAILPEKGYLMTASAITPAEVCVIPVASVEEVIFTNKEACIVLMEDVKKSVEKFLKYSLVMITGTAESKLAFALLALGGKEGLVTISKEEIARMTGLTRETVSRKLAVFNTNKFIEIKQRRVKIIRHEELLKLVS